VGVSGQSGWEDCGEEIASIAMIASIARIE
jgi:hypothetical protein